VNFFNRLLGRQDKRPVHSTEKKLQYREKRKFPRYGINEVTYLYPHNKPPIQVTLLDVGLGGVRMEAKEKLELDSKMGLVLYDRGIVVKVSISARWGNKGRLTYLYGAEFVELDAKTKAHINRYVGDMKDS